MDIIIVGAGIGGLAAAAALLQRSHRVRVFEQAAQLGEVGAGIQMSANAVIRRCAAPPFRLRLRLSSRQGTFIRPVGAASARACAAAAPCATDALPQRRPSARARTR